MCPLVTSQTTWFHKESQSTWGAQRPEPLLCPASGSGMGVGMRVGGQARTRGAGAAPACQCRQVDMRDGSLGGLVGLMTKSREAAGAGPGRGGKAEPARGDGPGISGAQPLMLAAMVAGTEVPVCCASAGYSPPPPPCFPWASSHTPGHLPQDRCELSHHFRDG